MKKQFVVKGLVFICLALVLNTGCNLDGECYNQVEVPVIRFEMPDSIPVDSSIQIGVVYVTYSNCSKLFSLLDNSSADTIFFNVIAEYEGCSCPETLPDSIAWYDFKSSTKRSYVFMGIKYDNTILCDTLKVY